MPTNEETNAARLLEPSPATRLIISFLMMTSTLSNSFLQLFHPKMPSQWPDSSTSNKAFGEDRQPPQPSKQYPYRQPHWAAPIICHKSATMPSHDH